MLIHSFMSTPTHSFNYLFTNLIRRITYTFIFRQATKANSHNHPITHHPIIPSSHHPITPSPPNPSPHHPSSHHVTPGDQSIEGGLTLTLSLTVTFTLSVALLTPSPPHPLYLVSGDQSIERGWMRGYPYEP